MVEHAGGCNIVYHESCRTRWCFACRRIGTCTDFDCRSPGSGPPSGQSTPRRASARGPAAAGASVAAQADKATALGNATAFVKVILALATLLVSLVVLNACMGLQIGVP